MSYNIHCCIESVNCIKWSMVKNEEYEENEEKMKRKRRGADKLCCSPYIFKTKDSHLLTKHFARETMENETRCE